MTPPQNANQPGELGKAVQDVTEISQKLIREEIELAKAEVAEKVAKLAKGAAVGAAAGVFAFFALIYLLHSLSWGLWQFVGDENGGYWLGFLLTAVILLVLAAIAGFLAYKFVKGGAPPTPKMAIEEAQKVKETVSR